MRAWTTAGAEPPYKGVLVAVMQAAELLERHSSAGQYDRSCGRASSERSFFLRQAREVRINGILSIFHRSRITARNDYEEI